MNRLNQHKLGKKTVLASILASLLFPALAQEQQQQTASEDDNYEVISVTFRGSLVAAADIKRQDTKVTDAITTEDIGILGKEAEDQPGHEVVHVSAALGRRPTRVLAQQLDVQLVQAASGTHVDGVVLDLLDGGDAGQRQEEAEVVGELRVVASDGIARGQFLGLQCRAVGSQDELGLGLGGLGAGLQRGERPALRRADALFPPDSVAWRVNGDIVTMMIGGVSGLLLQMLHPAVLAGVWDHSDFRADMHGRLRRTAKFIAVTTYDHAEAGRAAIDKVNRIHAKLGGTLPDGASYRVSDPHLLAWVHVTETISFLDSWIRYAEPDMSMARQDAYFAAKARMALA